MPALINIAANILLGGSMALVTRRSEAMHAHVIAWPFLLLLAFESLVVTPIATFLFRFYPQWSMLYWFDPQIYTGLNQWIGPLSAVAIIANFIGAIGAYCITRLGIIEQSTLLKCLAPTVAIAGTTAILWEFGARVAFVGDYDAFWQGQADLIFKHVAGWMGLIPYLGGFVFVLWVHTRFGEHDPQLF